MWAVETKGLSKAYGPVTSLVDCDLQVPLGEVFGLLGPNGAGKTTLLRTLLGFLTPTAGRAWVGGFEVGRQSVEVRRYCSYLPGDARLYRGLRGRGLLEMFSGLHPHGSLDGSLAVAQRLDLDLSRRVLFMSTGMRQKLALAIVVGCRAPLIVLDEPTANLDPSVRAEVLKLVGEIRQQGRTVLLSSHIFSDVDQTCDQVVILREGRIVAKQAMRQLEQLHIASGLWRGAAAALQSLCQRDFVQYSELDNAEQADPPSGIEPEPEREGEQVSSTELELGGVRRVELHLRGSPNLWLNWLAELQLGDLQIEKAGVAAIYQQHHQR